MSNSGNMRTVRIKAPVDDAALKELAIGDVVYLDGVIFTGREALYRHVVTEGKPPPPGLFDLTNVNFHCSPAAAVSHAVVSRRACGGGCGVRGPGGVSGDCRSGGRYDRRLLAERRRPAVSGAVRAPGPCLGARV